MSDEYNLNFKFCDGLDISVENIFGMAFGMFEGIDPDGTMWWNKIGRDDYIPSYDEESSYSAGNVEYTSASDYYTAAATAMCRAAYDDNDIASQQLGFCCQALCMEYDDENCGIYGFLTDAISTTQSEAIEEEISGTTYYVYFGAELFDSARVLGASLASLTVGALVFYQ